MMTLLRRIYPLRLAPNSPDLVKAYEMLQDELPFETREYAAGAEHNGWVVPHRWSVVKAEIRKGGKLVYDGLAHPLGVIGNSQSFKGTVGVEELKKHLFCNKRWPNDLVYHCDLYYKVGQKNWGFCMPWNKIKALPAGQYDVELETKHEKLPMPVLEYHLPGDSDRTIILNAHSCHAGQANDDVAGMVVSVEVMRRLAARPRRRYSYRLIIAAEHFGTVFYLAGLKDEEVKRFKYGMFLEMLGNDNRLALQESFTGQAEIDLAAHHYLKHNRPDYFSGPFRSIVGNDETVWEAAGYEIPTISLSRFPYGEYHTSKDTEDIILEEKLEDSVQAVLGYLDILETNKAMTRNFKGLIALSNPKYDLYMPTFDPSIRPTISEEQKRWNRLMDYLPRYFDGKTTILDIARKHEIPYEPLLAYLRRFEEKALIRFVEDEPAPRPARAAAARR